MMQKIILFIVVFFNISLSYALNLHTATYEISRKGLFVGNETRTLGKIDEQYIYTANAQSEGLVALFFDYSVTAKSTFTTTPHITPIKYSIIEKEGGEITNDVSLEFNEYEVSSQNHSWQSNERIIDNLSIFLALGDDLKHNRELSYQIADGKNLTTYVFSIVGMETINILGKEVEGIKVSNNKDTTVIISPEYQYLPVFVTKKNWQYKLMNIDF